MRTPIPVSRVCIRQVAIPLRRTFRHAVVERSVSEPIIVSIELADGTIGYGETHPRRYVTGETNEGAVSVIRDEFVPRLLDVRPTNFGEAIEAAAELPMHDAQGRVAAAARAAVELALLDAYSRSFGRSIEQLAGWIEHTDFGAPGSSTTVRFGGVASSLSAKRAVASVRRMRLAGLRDFKLKVGDDDDAARLQAVIRSLGGSLERGKTTLRIDANGAWTPDQAAEKLQMWQILPIACVEQPLAKGANDRAAELAAATSLPLMADESLVTADDAEDLIVRRAASWFNIRISKNGGLIPALQLAVTARRHDIACQLGCMVGETSILSAAGRWFLQLVPGVRFAEGSYGRFLLKDDVVRPSVRFGFAGRWRPMTGHGLGVTIDPQKLEQLSIAPPIDIPL